MERGARSVVHHLFLLFLMCHARCMSPSGCIIGAVFFTARRVCIARTMPSQDVRLSACRSVRPSVTRQFESKRLHILKVFSPSGSITILVFTHLSGWQYSDGDPLTGSRIQGGTEKNHDFRPISRFISQLMQDRVKVTMEGE